MTDASEVPHRTRTIRWHDPTDMARLAPGMSGIDFLQGIQRGDLPAPPLMEVLGIRIGEVEHGRVVFVVEPAEYHYNPIGSVHGGLAATIFDSALGCSVHSTLPAGVTYTTLELKVNFLRPLTVNTGSVFCEGRVIHVGQRVATAEARLIDAAGKLYGHATTTCMIFRPSG